jgi:hypothetical protein
MVLMNILTASQIRHIDHLNMNSPTGFGSKIQEIINAVNGSIGIAGTPVNAVNATKTLSVSGVVIDSETVTVNNPAIAGVNVYEFLADTAQTKTVATNIAVDITASTTKAARVLTIDTQPTIGDTMTIGAKVYTFVAVGTATSVGKISVGADLAGAKLAIVAAINGTDAFNIPHPSVTAGAFTVNACTLTALVGGVAGNAIATTETFTAGTNIFAGATLAAGADCTAANAITALVAAITASDTQGVGAADGAGDTVDLTADVAGVVGNTITIGETMVNGAFAAGAVLLSGGVDGTVGGIGQTMIDATYLYTSVANNTTADKNWRRIALASAVGNTY